MSAKIKKDDYVFVLTGRDKNKTGIVKKINTKNFTAIVSGINYVKRHVKADPNKQKLGGILKKEAPIHISNLSFFDKERKKIGRVGFCIKDGKKSRFLKFNNKKLNI